MTRKKNAVKWEKTWDQPEYHATITDGLVIIVHRVFGVESGWFVTCHGASMANCPLRNLKIQDAKSEALSVVYARLQTWIGALDDIDPSKWK